jgi:hypothetical protein
VLTRLRSLGQQLRESGVLEAISGPRVGTSSFRSVHNIFGSNPALCVKRMKAPCNTTQKDQKECVLLRLCWAVRLLDIVLSMHDSFMQL